MADLDVVREGTTYIIPASFTDQDGAAVTPSSGTYRIDDITDGVKTQVKDDTTFTPASATHEIEVTPEENVILDQAHEIETRLVTVLFTYGAGRKGAGEIRYYLKNMKGV